MLILKNVLKSPRIYILAGLCLLFLTVFQNVVFPASYRTVYGIFLDGADYGQDMLNRLAEDDLYTFELLDSREALMDEVRSGRLDCGFILDSRLNDMIDIGNMQGLMDYVFSTSTTKGPVLREKVFAAFLMNAAQQMLVSFTTDGKTFVNESEQLTEDILASFHGFLDRGETLQVIFETVDADAENAAEADAAAASMNNGNAGSSADAADTDGDIADGGTDAAAETTDDGNSASAAADTPDSSADAVPVENTADGNSASAVADTADGAADGEADASVAQEGSTSASGASSQRQRRTLDRNAGKKNLSGSGDASSEASARNSDYVPAEVSLADRFLALCGTLIFVAAIVFGRTRFSPERKRMVNAMRGTDRAMWSFLSILAPVMVIDVAITAAYLTGMFIYKSLTPMNALTSVGIFLLYGLVCSIWAYIYSLLFHRESMYLGTFIGVIILSLLTCRSFFPMGSLIPVLDVLKWAFPVNYIL